jgi:hypothetical protein
VRKSTLIVAIAASAAMVAAAAGPSLAAGNSGHSVTVKQSHYTPSKAAPMAGFKAFDQPVAKYTSKSCDIDLSSIADFTDLTSVKGCGTTVTLSTTFDKRSVPASWGTWGSPPDTESATPNLLYSNGATSATVDFGKKVKTGGFEIEPNPFEVHSFTVEFHKGANGTGAIVGTITRDADGNAGAKLFGGHRKHGFKSAVITTDTDFAIAQIRV